MQIVRVEQRRYSEKSTLQRCQAEEGQEVMAEVAVAMVEVEVQGDPHQDQEATMMAATMRTVNQTRWNSHHIMQERHKVQHMTQ